MKKLFIVEDDPLLRKMLIPFMEMKFPGVQVEGSSADGEEAIRQCIEIEPDLVICDIDLPNMSGLEILQILRKRIPNTKVIIYSGVLNPRMVEIAINGKADGILPKSAKIDEIVDAINAVLEGKRYYTKDIQPLVKAYEKDML